MGAVLRQRMTAPVVSESPKLTVVSEASETNPQSTKNDAPPVAGKISPPFSIPPSDSDLAFMAEASIQLEEASPREIIAWAVEHYFPQLTMATAFGPEGCVIIHMLATIEPRVHVFNLDTGYQFKETLELRDKIATRYGITVEYKRPATTVEEYEAQHEGQI